MVRQIIALVLSFSLAVAVISPSAYAAPGDEKVNKSSSAGPRRHLANIIFAGLAGAVLGLSTLSFYGRPQDKLNNIAIGAAIGIIGGTFYSTYKAASEPRDFYGEEKFPEPESWKLMDIARDTRTDRPLSAGLTFSF